MRNILDPFNEIIHAASKIIHAHHEQDAVKYTGDEYPFPKPVLNDKFMGFEIRLYCNNQVFQQWDYI
jgi:hypothetical protein